MILSRVDLMKPDAYNRSFQATSIHHQKASTMDTLLGWITMAKDIHIKTSTISLDNEK